MEEVSSFFDFYSAILTLWIKVDNIKVINTHCFSRKCMRGKWIESDRTNVLACNVNS